MTGVNWGLNRGGGFENALAMGMQMGREVRQAKQQNALLEQRQQQLDLQQRQAQRVAQRQQQEQRRADLPMVTRLLEGATDEASYQRNLGVAQQYGIDTSTFPQNFDPVWREQNLATLKMLGSPDGQKALSAIGKEVADMGFQPGTPEFNAEVTRRWEQGQTKTVPYQAGGNVLEYNSATGTARPLVQGMSSPPSAGGGSTSGEVMTFQQLQGIAQSLSPEALQRQIGRLVQGGVVFSVSSPEQARQLPSGTPILLPDGTQGRVP